MHFHSGRVIDNLLGKRGRVHQGVEPKSWTVLVCPLLCVHSLFVFVYFFFLPVYRWTLTVGGRVLISAKQNFSRAMGWGCFWEGSSQKRLNRKKNFKRPLWCKIPLSNLSLSSRMRFSPCPELVCLLPLYNGVCQNTICPLMMSQSAWILFLFWSPSKHVGGLWEH